MKSFKRILAILCSATLIVSAPVTAFAEDTTPDPVASSEGTTGTAGTGNVLAYNFDTVVVPTTIKISFNPQGLAIAKRSGETAVTSQIVSLNYGIASKASQDKKVIVKFAANKSLNGESSDVVFVSSAEAIADQANAEDTVGAPNGSHRIFLKVVPATSAPKYYDSTSEAEDKGTAFSVTTVADGKNTDDVTAAHLSDVVMTAATAGVATFTNAGAEAQNDAYAVLGYKLTKATYAAMEDLTFDTTAAQVADKMEITALGQIAGFTFDGSMNTNTDWTKANLSAIAITPIYELADAGTEDAVTGAEGVITLTAADTAEPDKPLTAEEIAAAAATAAATTAANTFKTDYASVLALTADTVEGTEEELAAITAASEAFDALGDAVKTILAEDSIDADFFAALAEASEAAATPAATSVTTAYDSTNLRYEISLPDGVTISDTSEVTNLKVDGVAFTGTINKNGQGSKIRLSKEDVKTAATAAETWSAGNLTITFTIDGTNYTTSFNKAG